MTSRERVLKALNHQEPDRVPCDLGGTIMTGIMAHALARLREHLGIKDRPPKVYEPFQMLGEVEADIIERLGIDVLPVEPPVQFFGLRRENYKPWRFWDGTLMLVPGQFNVEVDAAGDYLIRHEGDPAQPVVGRMPKDGYYFDSLAMMTADPDFQPPTLDEVRKENHLTAEDLDLMQARAEHLRATTDKALLLGGWGKVGLGGVGSTAEFLVVMATDRAYVTDMLAVRNETSFQNLEKLKAALGDNIDILGLDGDDYGSQRSELFAPEWFEELFLPHFRQQNHWVHQNTNWKTWQHSCGSIPRIIPMLVDAGLDVLNPVQCSAAGMDPRWLKDTFGDKLTFWGGGVDTQKTFPFGTPEEVAAEVEERIRTFAPGGGYVFNAIHNIQHGTPPENILAAFDTARRVGVYPIR